jgi:hypothetical protein
MAKRIFLALLVLTLAAGGAFAQLSAGIGGNFAVSWDSYTVTYPNLTGTSTSTTPGGGFYAFFDATYVEVDVGLLFGGNTTTHVTVSEGTAPDDSVWEANSSYLTLALYGKYPIDLGGFILSPMLGIQYDIGLSVKDNDGNEWELEASDKADFLNKFWVKLGVGADINLSDALYLRPSVLYGINFGTKMANDSRDEFNKQDGVTQTDFNSGLDIRVALGFKF